jgi:hypothetical protein
LLISNVSFALDIVVTNLKNDPKDCGGRDCQWKFELSGAAPCDGYFVQQMDRYLDRRTCEKDPPAKPPDKPTETFWEAWPVKKGDKGTSVTTTLGYTDSSFSATQENSCGFKIATGTIKFYCATVTGDLGDFDKAPADPNSKWGPGKNPVSGQLPSTKDKPDWWDKKEEAGPASRKASSEWCCCTDRPKKNVVKCEP